MLWIGGLCVLDALVAMSNSKRALVLGQRTL